MDRTRHYHDRRGRDRTAQRADALLTLVRMRQVESGGREHTTLRESVIVEYMSYDRHLAVRYAGRGRIGEDLRQVACVGLIKTIDDFDPEHGTAFLSYATPTILGELKRYFRDRARAVHVPRGVQELNGRMQPATDVLTQHLHRAPTVPEIAGIQLADPGDVLEAIDATGLHHLDSFGYAGQRASKYGSLVRRPARRGGGPGMQRVVERETLRPLLARLPARNRASCTCPSSAGCPRSRSEQSWCLPDADLPAVGRGPEAAAPGRELRDRALKQARDGRPAPPSGFRGSTPDHRTG